MKQTFIEHIKKRLLIVALIIIGVIIIVPLLLNFVLPIETGVTVMGLDAWLGFWGSFIGGVFTIIALWITIEYTAFENEKTRTQSLIDSENTRRASQEENEKLRQNQLDVLKIELNIDKLDRDYIKIKEFIYKAYKILNLGGINNLSQYPNLNFEESFTYELQLLGLETNLLFSELVADSYDDEFFGFISEKIEALVKVLGEGLGFNVENESELMSVMAQFESGDFSKITNLFHSETNKDEHYYLEIKKQLLIAKCQYSVKMGQLVKSYLSYKHAKYTMSREKLIGEKIATIEGDKKVPTLEWIGKDKVINHHNDVPYRVLDEVYTYGADKSENKIIRGDNLEALKALLPQYEGRIKCIYIDPPYNTGNEGWVYNDNVNDPKIRKWLGEVVGKEGEDLSRHDKWLCMMYPRLKLLQRLLAENGAIFISIDDNEQSNLKLICDEIFGARNFVSSVIRATGTHTGVGSQMIARETDYILVYAKSINETAITGLPLSEKDMKIYDMEDEYGRFLIRPLRRTGGENRREDRPNMYYPLTAPDGTIIYPIGPTGYESRWICVPETYKRFEEAHRILWKKIGKENKWQVYQKFYIEERTKTISNLWSDIEGNKKATKDIRAIFDDESVFDYPKPTMLIEQIMRLATDPNSIILDSFAGSGTTAHAVLNMNKSDGGNRKFILVELMDYAETITAERVRRVIDGYGECKNAMEGTGGDFTFYDLGAPLMIDNQYLNEDVPLDKLRQYVFFMETKQTMGKDKEDEMYLLGTYQNAAYYFYYEKETVTTLDHSFLSGIKTQTEEYLIYADINALSNEELAKHHVIFKKIPRDIAKL